MDTIVKKAAVSKSTVGASDPAWEMKGNTWIGLEKP